MDQILQSFLHNDIRGFVQSIGLIGVWIVLFAESGLLIGFFLPGDSMIFTAGLLASPLFNFFNIWILLTGAWIAAVVGDNVGYEFGKRVGRKLFTREKTFLFNPSNLVKAEEFYEKYGGKAIVLARFVPVIRTFAPIVAGVGHMDHKKFTIFNAIGGFIWVWGLGLLGFLLGEVLPEDFDIDKYLLPMIAAIIILSVLPPVWHLYKENKKALGQKFVDFLKQLKYRFSK